jgi:hypothetical protein
VAARWWLEDIEAPVDPDVTRNGGVGPRHRSLSTSPNRTTLAASDPGVDHPQILVFLGRIAGTTLSALKTGSIGREFVGGGWSILVFLGRIAGTTLSALKTGYPP